MIKYFAVADVRKFEFAIFVLIRVYQTQSGFEND